MYPLGKITGLTDGNLTVLGSTDTYFSVLLPKDIVILNEQSVEVNTPINDSKFTVKTALTSGNIEDVLYCEDRCVWLKYQIWKIDVYLSNSTLGKFGVETIKNDRDEVKYSNQNTNLSELMKLRNKYQSELDECLATKNGESPWMFRRFETGTY